MIMQTTTTIQSAKSSIRCYVAPSAIAYHQAETAWVAEEERRKVAKKEAEAAWKTLSEEAKAKGEPEPPQPESLKPPTPPPPSKSPTTKEEREGFPKFCRLQLIVTQKRRKSGLAAVAGMVGLGKPNKKEAVELLLYGFVKNTPAVPHREVFDLCAGMILPHLRAAQPEEGEDGAGAGADAAAHPTLDDLRAQLKMKARESVYPDCEAGKDDPWAPDLAHQVPKGHDLATFYIEIPEEWELSDYNDPVDDVTMTTVVGNDYRVKASLENCFEQACKAQDMTGQEQCYCSKCQNHEDARKTETLFRLPPYLVIQLKRFYVSFDAETMRKTNIAVPFPEDLDLAKYAAAHVAKAGNTKYRLRGVVHHSGSLSFGHYTASALSHPTKEQITKAVEAAGGDETKGTAAAMAAGTWVMYNDSSAYEAKLPSDAPESAYILFYERVGDAACAA